MLTLDVAIATWKADGITRVVAMNLPQVEGVRYVVSWQGCEGLSVPEELLQRSDVSVCRTTERGLSANRNNALEHCTSDIVLISDDDLIYTAEQLQAVQRAFEEHPEVELATFRYVGDDASAPAGKTYPATETDLTVMPKNYWIATFEIAVRRQSLAGKVRFNTEFGPGAPFIASGEDEVFLLTARRRGCCCRFFPITITTHVGLTTGLRKITDVKVLHGMGAQIRLEYGVSAIPRIVLKAWRMSRNGQCRFLKGLCGLLRGWHFAAHIKI
jgi:hypothetical protein